MQDQRPAGFLGRAVPMRYPELALPQRVVEWNDDHYLRYLTQRGSDTVGDLVLGDRALDEALQLMHQRPAIPEHERATRYPQLVEQIMEGGFQVHRRTASIRSSWLCSKVRRRIKCW